jgi:hypothetical protein
MNHLFHTEDCGVSLLCRCCRSPVCKQRLSKADRMRLQPGWGAYPIRQDGAAGESARGVLGRFVVNLFQQIAARRAAGQKTPPFARSTKLAATARRRVP